MIDKLCHKLINENIKTLCHETLGDENNLKKKNGYFTNSMSMNCSSKCEELCNNINDRLQKIKDIVHLRSTKPNAILIETLIYIKEYIKEIQKYIEMFNNVIYEENKAYAYVEDIFNSLDRQNQNIQKIYHICSKNIVITKNNNELVLQKPQSYSSLSSKFVSNLLSVCKEGNESKGFGKNEDDCASSHANRRERQAENKHMGPSECPNEDYVN
ncbi:conserved Plasmodium protein, unknown function [Plasmodium ovale]|uniref:Uncharacterized protein n=1 Tax=Plasmodium ovale TaxID=36330 RepID=A0A1C3KQE4_PLAOA|nr:conserved Plasmodium protein, unknown function [Plasmodium ovale]